MTESMTPDLATGARRAVALVRHYRNTDHAGRDALADEIAADPNAAAHLIEAFVQLLDALILKAYGPEADQALAEMVINLAAAEHEGGNDDD